MRSSQRSDISKFLLQKGKRRTDALSGRFPRAAAPQTPPVCPRQPCAFGNRRRRVSESSSRTTVRLLGSSSRIACAYYIQTQGKLTRENGVRASDATGLHGGASRSRLHPGLPPDSYLPHSPMDHGNSFCVVGFSRTFPRGQPGFPEVLSYKELRRRNRFTSLKRRRAVRT